jgi:hypothetical protein
MGKGSRLAQEAGHACDVFARGNHWLRPESPVKRSVGVETGMMATHNEASRNTTRGFIDRYPPRR